jgi:uncharacterized protein (DUF1778 family)
MSAKAGRPKLPTNKTRAVFPIRISEDERKIIDAAAAKAGERPSEWARNQLLAAAARGNS